MSEDSKDLLFLLAADGTILDYGAQQTEDLLVQPEDFLGKRLQDVLPPALADQYQRMTEAVAGGGSGTCSYSLPTPGGTRHYHARLDRLSGSDRLISVVRDVTHQRRNEIHLAKSKQQYRAISGSTVDGIVVADTMGTIVEWNRAAEVIFGYEERQILGRSFEILIPERFRERHWRGFARIVEQNEESTGGTVREVWGLREDGSEIPLEISFTRFGDGEDRFLCGMFRDISERERQAEELRRLAAAIDQVGEAVFITGPTGIIEYTNEAFEAVTGYSLAEAVGNDPRLLKSGEQDALFYERYWNRISSGKTWTGDITNRRKDGSRYQAAMTVSPVFGEDGEIKNYIAVQRDVSKQRDLEKQLHQAQKMEAVGRLAGGIAHDFNNLLTAILGYADLGRSALEPGHAVREDLDAIQQAGEQAAELTRQLLAFSRQQVLQPKVLDLNEVVAGIESLWQRTMGEDVRLITRLDIAPGRIKADKSQIEQVLMNLAVNARDAMPHGGDLTLETRCVYLGRDHSKQGVNVRPGAYVRLTVTDTGSGMTDEVRRRAFEPFFTTKGRDQGTGLGLSTLYGIVKQSGGYVWVDSELGQGTTFEVLLPQTEEQVEQSKPRTALPEGALGGRTILVVEDNPQVRSLTRRVLEEEGHRVISTETAEEALELSNEELRELDLVLSDFVLPQMNGFVMSQEILLRNPNLPMILMSGYSRTAQLKRQPDLSGVHFLPKPFLQADLLRAVGIALTSKSRE